MMNSRKLRLVLEKMEPRLVNLGERLLVKLTSPSKVDLLREQQERVDQIKDKELATYDTIGKKLEEEGDQIEDFTPPKKEDKDEVEYLHEAKDRLERAKQTSDCGNCQAMIEAVERELEARMDVLEPAMKAAEGLENLDEDAEWDDLREEVKEEIKEKAGAESENG